MQRVGMKLAVLGWRVKNHKGHAHHCGREALDNDNRYSVERSMLIRSRILHQLRSLCSA